jgi:hypothetical protein
MVLGVFRRQVDCPDARAAAVGVRALHGPQVATFIGFSGTGYEDEDMVRDIVEHELDQLDRSKVLICAGATPDGIGLVYPIAVRKGFWTAGIVSRQALVSGAQFSTECEVVFVVDDATWGGRQANDKLSPTSQAMINASDTVIGIGGGAIARDELEEARQASKTVRFHRADMNHALAIDKAAKAGQSPPTDFGGEAQTLFPTIDIGHP